MTDPAHVWRNLGYDPDTRKVAFECERCAAESCQAQSPLFHLYCALPKGHDGKHSTRRDMSDPAAQLWRDGDRP